MNAGAEHLTWGASDGSAYGRSQRWMCAEDRSAAWGFRSLANALATAPATIADQVAYRSAIKTHIEAGLGWWVSTCVGNNTLGIMSRGDHPYGVTGGYDDTGAFMQYFASQCFAFANDIIGSGDLGSTATTNLHDSAMFHAKLPVGLAGTVPDGHCYRNAAAYNLPVQTKSGSVYTWLADFAAVYAARVERGEIAAGDACSDGSTLTGGNFPESGSYWGNYLPALAYAVDLGAPGAAAAWARVTGASNYETLRAGFANTAPQFGIVPR